MKLKYTSLVVLCAGMLFSSCKKEQTVFEDPYSGGRPPLGIVTNAQQLPSPSIGEPGTLVNITATGLKEHEKSLTFFFNGQQAEIKSVTDKGITVVVPEKASSGVTSFVVDGQLVFGPRFRVSGKAAVDFTFTAFSGTNGAVNKAVPGPDGTLYILGNFTSYNNSGSVRPTNRIVRISPNGSWDRSYPAGTASNGQLFGMVTLNGWNYIAGDFSGYQQRGDISRITRISTGGAIDTTSVLTYTQKIKYIPKFNGGVTSTIRSLYTFGGKLIATGDFNYYVSRRYDINSYKYQDSTALDSVEVRQLIRFNEDGSLDRTWRFDENAIGYKGQKGKSWAGGTGRTSTLMHTDGRILCYGQFTRFDDVAAGYITRLNPDGTKDATFNPGTGASDYIYSVNYNVKLKKYVLAGRFKSFNGKPAAGIVVLNEDGSVDESFKVGVIEGGLPYYAKQLDDGLIVVSGDFKSYDRVARVGFLITDATGALAQGYNNLGNVTGSAHKINDIYETQSADGRRALLIMGDFNRFDDQQLYYNFVRITLN